MVVRIRFGRGRMVARRKGKNSRMAQLAASGLTLVSISCLALGTWRLCADLKVAGDFAFPSGILSHWQLWLGVGAAVQYGCLRLTRYARAARENELDAIASAPKQGARRAVLSR